MGIKHKLSEPMGHSKGSPRERFIAMSAYILKNRKISNK
jgi:hypothetical protein